MSLETCIPNLKLLSLMVGEIFLTKNLERKKKEQKQRTANKKMPICNPTIQLVLVNLFTKYEVSILNGCGDIFDEKVLRNYGRTDGRTDGTTDRCKPVYPPLFQSGCIIMLALIKIAKMIWYARTILLDLDIIYHTDLCILQNRNIILVLLKRRRRIIDIIH